MRLLIALVTAFAVLGCASLAPEPKPKAEARPAGKTWSAPWQRSCRADYAKYCEKWTDTDGTPADCLARVEKELSGRCYQVLRETASPCVFDRARLCSHLPPSSADMGACLDKKGKEVSNACRAHRSGIAEKARSIKRVCEKDSERLCGDAKAPWRCLRRNLENLSATCKSEVAKNLRVRRRAG
jgi:hypothetical protein